LTSTYLAEFDLTQPSTKIDRFKPYVWANSTLSLARMELWPNLNFNPGRSNLTFSLGHPRSTFGLTRPLSTFGPTRFNL